MPRDLSQEMERPEALASPRCHMRCLPNFGCSRDSGNRRLLLGCACWALQGNAPEPAMLVDCLQLRWGASLAPEALYNRGAGR